jgi:RecA-family ATPase
LANGKNLDLKDIKLYPFVQKHFNLSDPASVARMSRNITAIKPQMIIVDALIRVHKANENSASEMAVVFDEIKKMVTKHNVAFVIAHHEHKPKEGDDSQMDRLRGTSDMSAFPDVVLSMRIKDNFLQMDHSKARYDVAIPSFRMAITDTSIDSTQVINTGNIV